MIVLDKNIIQKSILVQNILVGLYSFDQDGGWCHMTFALSNFGRDDCQTAMWVLQSW